MRSAAGHVWLRSGRFRSEVLQPQVVKRNRRTAMRSHRVAIKRPNPVTRIPSPQHGLAIFASTY